MINQLRQQMKNKMQKCKTKSRNQFGFRYQFEMLTLT